MITDERIRERKLGELEGHEITDEMESKIWNYDLNYQIPGGESVQDFEKRIINFMEEIKEKYQDKTVLIVAQRISTIMNADQIIVLDEGNIAGIGTHKELMKKCKIYKEIALSQLSKEEL